MSAKTNLHVADPCHENWQNMTSTEQGKFCQSCRKEVIDFSLLSDKQILDYFSKHKGNTCGRFREDQLDRPLDNSSAKNKISLWKWFVTVGLGIWFSNKSVAQTSKGKANSKTQLHITDTTETFVTMGMVFTPVSGDKKDPKQKDLHIEGKVVNEAGEPISGASISLNGKDYTSSASNGVFNIYTQIPRSKGKLELSFSSIGYETKTVGITPANKEDMVIQMTSKANELNEVVVTGYGTKKGKVCVSGAVSVVRTRTLTQVVDSVKKITDNVLGKAFNTYPNPVQKGSFVNVNMKEEGTYSLQLISNASQMISSQKINVITGQIFQLQISNSLSAGIYYIRMVNEVTGKQYTDKVVVL